LLWQNSTSDMHNNITSLLIKHWTAIVPLMPRRSVTTMMRTLMFKLQNYGRIIGAKSTMCANVAYCASYAS
jgi:hypothetical protein